jgi:hypothetical protein
MTSRRRFLACLGPFLSLSLFGCAAVPGTPGTSPLAGVAAAIAATVKVLCGFEPYLPAVEALITALFPGVSPALVPINGAAQAICAAPTIPPTARHARIGARLLARTGARVIHFVPTPRGIVPVPSM